MKNQFFLRKFYQTILFAALFFIALKTNAQLIDANSYKHTIKVACVGNSITWGSKIENRDSLSYPAQLGRMLGSKWDVRNFGVSGRTLLSKGDRPYIKEQAFIDAKAFQPDVVLIKLGTNDTKPQNWQYKSELKSDYKSLVESFQNLDSKPLVVLMKAVPAFPEHWGIRDSLINGELNPMVEALTKELGLPCIDLYTPLKEHGDLFPDRIHPNAKGAGIMAETIYLELTKAK